MARRPGAGRRLAGIARTQPPPAALRPPARVQLPLFTGLPRAYRYGRIDLRTDAVPGNPWLAWALHLAHTTAEARGWDAEMLQTVNRVLVMLLAGYAEGRGIQVSDFRQVLRGRGNSIGRTAEILDAMGILADDRPAAFDAWLAASSTALPPESAPKPAAGHVPCTTAPRASRPCTTRASGSTSPRSARPCWPGRPATATCGRSPAMTSATASPRTARRPRARRPWPRAGPCSPGRRRTA